jgi:hypothetical protein
MNGGRHADLILISIFPVVQEASLGDTQAVLERQEVLQDLLLLGISDNAISLAETLVLQKAIPEDAVEDALHIALATVNGMDYLVTWNFKHIANAAMRANVELVCRLNGYEPPVICTPLELMEV